jgi:hypothetical protein
VPLDVGAARIFANHAGVRQFEGATNLGGTYTYTPANNIDSTDSTTPNAPAADDTSSVATCFRTGPIQARKAPMAEIRPGRFVPDFAYRYMTEDVPYGLVVTKAVGEIAGVETPMIDEVVTWAQSVTERRYLLGGKLEGQDAEGLPIPQNHGISTLGELVEWYSAS